MFAPDAKSFPPGVAAVIGLPAMHAFTLDYLKAGLSEFREGWQKEGEWQSRRAAPTTMSR